MRVHIFLKTVAQKIMPFPVAVVLSDVVPDNTQ